MKRYDIVTIFPEIVEAYAGESILARAAKKRILRIHGHDLRRWATDKHRTVDDTPYGGGPGMVMKVEPFAKAVAALRKKRSRVILLSAQGAPFTARDAKRLARYDQLLLLSGRYEGVDQRVADYLADEELSVGPYVLTGGELPALAIVDAVARHLPGVLGRGESLEEVHGSFPQYTKPRELKLKRKNKVTVAKVPDVLLSGDHAKIAAWRKRAERP